MLVQGSLSRAGFVQRGQGWDHHPSPGPFPLAELGGPAAAAVPAFTTCCLQMPQGWAL